ncbi:MAG: hypothetical protein WCY56_01730 [Aminobacteriaceae bacterium]
MQTRLQERKQLYRRIRGLSKDKYARVLEFVLSMEGDEPPLSAEEEEDLRVAYAQMESGEYRSFDFRASRASSTCGGMENSSAD